MAYIENPFRTGQTVRCIKDCSTVIVHSTNPALKGTVGTYRAPKEGDILTVDEVLGEYLRFDKYDGLGGDGYNWWFHTSFRPLSEAEAYLLEEGLDLEEEIKYGKSVIERIRSRIATNTININMDTPCKECGKGGATDNGLCLDCTAKRLIGGVKGPRRTFKKIKVDNSTAFLELAYTERVKVGDRLCGNDMGCTFKREVHIDLLYAMQAG